MALDAVHPLYTETLDDQTLMEKSYAGERTIKDAGVTYLPPTPGMKLDGMGSGQDGAQAYESYKQRAVYPDFVSTAVEALLGLMHKKPPTIELPDAMAPLLVKATADGETLEGLLRRINEKQLVSGRLGALLDFPENPDPAHPMPFIALYNSTAVRNWDDSSDNVDFDKLNLVILDESGHARDTNFQWKSVERYRVLMVASDAMPDVPEGYSYGVFAETKTFDAAQMTVPMVRGVKLDHIPFVFINTKDNLGRPDNPPLLGLARAALTVYQGEADYRQALFLQGQDTLVVIGGVRKEVGEEETRVGAGSKIEVDERGDAKYIGVSSTGLPELRQALENDYKRAEAKTGQLVDAMGSKQESGEALQTRLGAQTATLNQIARSGAAGLERLLKDAAKWLGQDPDKVKVTPNLEFADMKMVGKDLVDLMTAKNMGAPISTETIHMNMKEGGLTNKEYEEEMDLIDDEAPVMGTLSGGGIPFPDPNATPPAADKKPAKK